jgi:AcrR family transcriptional regulator
MPKAVSAHEREQKRKQIIQAAVGEFAQYGFAQTKFDTIAKRAGIGKGTIYLYFPSKQALFQAMLQEIAQDHLAQLRRALTDQPTLEARLSAVLATFEYLVRERPDELRIFISALYDVHRQFQAEAADHRRAYLTLLGELLREAEQAGEIRGDVELAALFILTVLGDSLSLQAQALSFPEGYIRAHQADILALLLTGVKGL